MGGHLCSIMRLVEPRPMTSPCCAAAHIAKAVLAGQYAGAQSATDLLHLFGEGVQALRVLLMDEGLKGGLRLPSVLQVHELALFSDLYSSWAPSESCREKYTTQQNLKLFGAVCQRVLGQSAQEQAPHLSAERAAALVRPAPWRGAGCG